MSRQPLPYYTPIRSHTNILLNLAHALKRVLPISNTQSKTGNSTVWAEPEAAATNRYWTHRGPEQLKQQQ
jgi:hypothetical protein